LYIELLCGTHVSMRDKNIKKQAKELRASGKTFEEIISVLGVKIPKDAFEKIEEERIKKLLQAQKKAVLVLKDSRKKHFDDLLQKNSELSSLLEKKEVAKIVLTALYLGEGTKNKRSAMVFANSNPCIISLFLRLFRMIFDVDEKKFRCTLQGRDGQDIKNLEKFWSNTTFIPLSQFYTPRIDPRSVGKYFKKPDYKGVCRIDYLSAEVFCEIMSMCEVLSGNIKVK